MARERGCPAITNVRAPSRHVLDRAVENFNIRGAAKEAKQHLAGPHNTRAIFSALAAASPKTLNHARQYYTPGRRSLLGGVLRPSSTQSIAKSYIGDALTGRKASCDREPERLRRRCRQFACWTTGTASAEGKASATACPGLCAGTACH